MERLFAALYLDEDVDVAIGEILAARGFSAITTRAAGLLGARDREQIDYAVRLGMAILTHNRADFEALHSEYLARGRDHNRIIVAGQRNRQVFSVRLLRLLNRLTADELKNHLVYI